LSVGFHRLGCDHAVTEVNAEAGGDRIDPWTHRFYPLRQGLLGFITCWRGLMVQTD